MEELNQRVCDAIATLRNNKRQANQNAIFKSIYDESKPLEKEQLIESINYLMESKVIRNKPHGGKDSYYINDDDSIESEETDSPLLTHSMATQKTIDNILNENERLNEQVKVLSN